MFAYGDEGRISELINNDYSVKSSLSIIIHSCIKYIYTLLPLVS